MTDAKELLMIRDKIAGVHAGLFAPQQQLKLSGAISVLSEILAGKPATRNSASTSPVEAFWDGIRAAKGALEDGRIPTARLMLGNSVAIARNLPIWR